MVDEVLWGQVKALAETEERSASWVVRQALERFLAREPVWPKEAFEERPAAEVPDVFKGKIIDTTPALIVDDPTLKPKVPDIPGVTKGLSRVVQPNFKARS